jgi:hypothetical protein
MRDLLSNFEEDHRSLGYGAEAPTHGGHGFSRVHAVAAILILSAAILFIGGHGLV